MAPPSELMSKSIYITCFLMVLWYAPVTSICGKRAAYVPFLAYSVLLISISATFTDMFSLKAISSACSKVMITGVSDESACSRMSWASVFGCSSASFVLYWARAEVCESIIPAKITAVTAKFFICSYYTLILLFQNGPNRLQISHHRTDYYWSKMSLIWFIIPKPLYLGDKFTNNGRE